MATNLEEQLNKIESIKNLNTKHLLSLHKNSRKAKFGFVCSCCGECLTQEDQEMYDFFSKWENKLKEELNTREHIETSKSMNKKIRQYCSKHKVSKEEAIKQIKGGK